MIDRPDDRDLPTLQDEPPRAKRPAVPDDPRENLLDLEPDAAERRLEAFMAEIGEARYRAGQVARRLWQKPAPSFEPLAQRLGQLAHRLE